MGTLATPQRCPVLVTGGAGYIGSHAVLALLDGGWPVAVIDDLSTGFRFAVPPGVPFYEGDIEDAGRPLVEMVPERIDQYPGHAALIESYRTRFNETLPRAIEGAHAIVRRLADRGVPLYALTNFGAEFWAGFRPIQPIFGLFEDVVVSGEERCAKPDPRLYAIAERRFGRPPQALFFTDDNPANVAAAAARGWQAHLFTDAAALEAELVTQGLLD